jgi:hypothetical protein
MVEKKPEKKPFGRDGPPKGYPKDQSVYADPENWRYPLHTSWHTRAARRYFDEPVNRHRYSQDEQEYIDRRINQALNKYGTPNAKPRRRSPPGVSIDDIERLTLEDLLRTFLGAPRFKRAKDIDDSLVSISHEDSSVIEGKVKEYSFRIDLPNRTILHDCQDWQKNLASKNMCKHLGKVFLMLDDGKSTNILRRVLSEKDQWVFTSPSEEKH